MMEFVELVIPGCYLVKPDRHHDARGEFLKVFHAPTWSETGLESTFVESYITTSCAGVVRGMHFQCPPADHAKLVCCIGGRARDGLLDLRMASPTYGKSLHIDLLPAEETMVYVPRGVAHGFAAWENNTRMLYMVTSVHDASADLGIRWDSVGIDWWAGKKVSPIVSTRDQGHPPFEGFRSPFVE